jgi:hypothetical protein
MWMPFALEKSGSLYKANEFREGKLKLLKDMEIELTESERETFNTLTSPRQIEKFIREIVNNRW